jgi:hypothetical protein
MDPEWSDIGHVISSGFSNSVKTYSFHDNFPDDYNYYRLKQIDVDGRSTYSNIILVKYKLDNKSQVTYYNLLGEEVQILIPNNVYIESVNGEFIRIFISP